MSRLTNRRHEPSDFKWSFSSWGAYNTCPAKYKFKYEQKLKGLPPGPAAARGIEIHDSIDQYIANESPNLESLHSAIDQSYMLPIMEVLRDHPNGERHTELPLYLTAEWEDTIKAFRWCTMILDAVRFGGDWRVKDGSDPHHNIVTIYEWKSGSPKDDHKDQRSLYALGALTRWQHAEEARVKTIYVEGKHPPSQLTVKRSGREKLIKIWQDRVDLIQRDQIKAPRPGMYCRWCDYAKDRGGPCQF